MIEFLAVIGGIFLITAWATRLATGYWPRWDRWPHRHMKVLELEAACRAGHMEPGEACDRLHQYMGGLDLHMRADFIDRFFNAAWAHTCEVEGWPYEPMRPDWGMSA